MVDVASQLAGHDRASRGAAPARGASRRNTTADRAIDVLLLFDDQHPVLSAVEVAEQLGMPRSTTYRYLQSLRLFGLVEEDEVHGGFRLGPRIFQLARVARKGLGLLEIAQPIMVELAERFGETVLLTRRTGRQVVCVERVEGPQFVRLSYERGHLMPAHAGASAKILLAFADPAEIDQVLQSTPFTRFTEHTVTNPEVLRAQLAEIREQRYVVSEGEVDPGVRAVAAPIEREDGRVVAGLTIVGPAFRVDDQSVAALLAGVCEAAARISRRLHEISG